VLLEKEQIDEKQGSLHVPEGVRDNMKKFSATAIIRGLSPFVCNDDHDNYLGLIYQVGDRVGVNPTTPMLSPAPPQWTFRNEDGSQDGTCMVHIADIIGVICENEEERKDFNQRVEAANRLHTGRLQ